MKKNLLNDTNCSSSLFVLPSVGKFNIQEFYSDNDDINIEADDKFWENMIIASDSKFAHSSRKKIKKFVFPAIFGEEEEHSDFEIMKNTGSISVDNKLKLLAVIKGLIVSQPKIDLTFKSEFEGLISSSPGDYNIFYLSEGKKLIAKITLEYVTSGSDSFNNGVWKLKYEEDFRKHSLGPLVYFFEKL